jgi:hypothetical protein
MVSSMQLSIKPLNASTDENLASSNSLDNISETILEEKKKLRAQHSNVV